MKFHQLFFASMHEPKKLAAFRLLPIGKVISYVFYFISIMTAISIVRYSVGDVSIFYTSPELQEYIESIGSLIYPVAFFLQLLISTFYIFFRISFFALIGMFLLKLLKKRGEYRHVWRTSAISITVPILLTIVLDFFSSMETYSVWITSSVHVLYILAAVNYYPKLKKT